MRTQKITEIFSCDTKTQVQEKIEQASHSSEFDLIEINVKKKNVKEEGEIVGYEYILKLVKEY